MRRSAAPSNAVARPLKRSKFSTPFRSPGLSCGSVLKEEVEKTSEKSPIASCEADSRRATESLGDIKENISSNVASSLEESVQSDETGVKTTQQPTIKVSHFPKTLHKKYVAIAASKDNNNNNSMF